MQRQRVSECLKQGRPVHLGSKRSLLACPSNQFAESRGRYLVCQPEFLAKRKGLLYYLRWMVTQKSHRGASLCQKRRALHPRGTSPFVCVAVARRRI